MTLVRDENARADRTWWQVQDRKVLKRIDALLQDVDRNGHEGIGKPERLKHGFHGHWSRRTTDEHRPIYKTVEDEIRIAACPLPLRELRVVDDRTYRSAAVAARPWRRVMP